MQYMLQISGYPVTILYMDWILSANQSFQYKSNLK